MHHFLKIFVRFFFLRIIFKVFIEFITILLQLYVWFSDREECGILVPRPGIKLVPPELEGKVLTTDHQGSPDQVYLQQAKLI